MDRVVCGAAVKWIRRRWRWNKAGLVAAIIGALAIAAEVAAMSMGILDLPAFTVFATSIIVVLVVLVLGRLGPSEVEEPTSTRHEQE